MCMRGPGTHSLYIELYVREPGTHSLYIELYVRADPGRTLCT